MSWFLFSVFCILSSPPQAACELFFWGGGRGGRSATRRCCPPPPSSPPRSAVRDQNPFNRGLPATTQLASVERCFLDGRGQRGSGRTIAPRACRDGQHHPTRASRAVMGKKRETDDRAGCKHGSTEASSVVATRATVGLNPRLSSAAPTRFRFLTLPTGAGLSFRRSVSILTFGFRRPRPSSCPPA